MAKISVIETIHKIGRLVFTTREIAGLTAGTMTSTTQCLKRLEDKGIIKKIVRGVWAFESDKRFSPFLVIPYLTPNHRAYLSFISALHIYDVISQIPQTITVASTSHTKIIRTPIGTFHIHQIAPDFFDGFDWHKSGDYLIASPEKAFVDCLYLAGRRKNQFANFPELDIERLDIQLVKKWTNKIKDINLRKSVLKRIDSFLR